MRLIDEPAHRLRVLLDAREVSAVEVTRAFLDRIEALNGTLKALAHVFPEAALAQAEAADRALAAGERRPLLGLPISIKESISTAGVASTLGLRSRTGERATADAAIVAELRGAGAIVLGKGNMSQLLLFHESENPLFGRTLNPWDADRTPGGSSGGEAAAIAAGLVPLGVGTDIGGSIRVPAAWCGIAGLKPTQDRWSNVGVVAALTGQEGVRGQCGPMARTSEDVAFLFHAASVDGLRARDPLVPPRPAGVRPLRRVGLFLSDGFLPASPSVERAVRRAGTALEAAGVEVAPFQIPEPERIVDTYFGLLSSDGARTIDALLAGDPVAPQLAELRRAVGLPGPVRALVARVLAARGEARVARILGAISEKRVAALWKLTAERSRLRLALHQAMETQRLDALVGPAHATVALRHGDSGDFSAGGLASMIFNFVHFPAGVVPVGRVETQDAARGEAGDRLERRARSVEQGSVGLPLAVQVVARPHDDDTVLAAMRLIEDGCRGETSFPRTPFEPRTRG